MVYLVLVDNQLLYVIFTVQLLFGSYWISIVKPYVLLLGQSKSKTKNK